MIFIPHSKTEWRTVQVKLDYLDLSFPKPAKGSTNSTAGVSYGSLVTQYLNKQLIVSCKKIVLLDFPCLPTLSLSPEEKFPSYSIDLDNDP